MTAPDATVADQPEYLVRGWTRGRQRAIFQARSLFVSHGGKYRLVNKGFYNERIRTGTDRTRVEIRGRDAIDQFGRPAVDRSPGDEVAKTAAGVKSVLRRLRSQEAERLSTIDADIAALTARLSALRTERKAVLAEAWAKGHVVRVNELAVRPDPEVKAS